jgi:hypothetical protein
MISWLIFYELVSTEQNIRRSSVSDKRLTAGWETYKYPTGQEFPLRCHVQTCMATVTQDLTCNSYRNVVIIWQTRRDRAFITEAIHSDDTHCFSVNTVSDDADIFVILWMKRRSKKVEKRRKYWVYLYFNRSGEIVRSGPWKIYVLSYWTAHWSSNFCSCLNRKDLASHRRRSALQHISQA